MPDLIKRTQYRYSTNFSEGRWHVLAEDDLGNLPFLIAMKASEAEARATVNYMQTLRTRAVMSPRMSKWF